MFLLQSDAGLGSGVNPHPLSPLGSLEQVESVVRTETDTTVVSPPGQSGQQHAEVPSHQTGHPSE